MDTRFWRIVVSYVLAVIVTFLMASSCASPAANVRSSPSGVATTVASTSQATATLESTPFPYTTPLPPLIPTLLDGIYTKFDPRPGTPVPCRRCPDYLPSGGEWRLQFDRGIYRISYAVTGWRSVGSFSISGDQLVLFNDPTCHKEVGVYKWKLDRDVLTLEVIEDPCAIELRAANLTNQPWTRSE